MEFFSEKMNKNGAKNTIKELKAKTHSNFRKKIYFLSKQKFNPKNNEIYTK